MANSVIKQQGFKEVSITVNTNYIADNYSRCFTDGKIVILFICFNLSTLPTSVNAMLITGLPSINISAYCSGANSKKDALRMRVLNGELKFEDVPTNTGFVNGLAVYMIK